MRELKVRPYTILPSGQCYDRDEADKVIEELEETLKNSRNARKYWRKEYLFEYKECCHHKYKRCLAMAKWCAAMSVDNQHNYKNFPTHKSKFRIEHYSKWYMRWMELAEKFKTNSTAK